MEINNFMRHHVYGRVLQSKVFESWYLDINTNRWCQSRPLVHTCDCKHIEYYLIDGIRYYDFGAAIDAMKDLIVLDALFDEDECNDVCTNAPNLTYKAQTHPHQGICMGDLQ